MSLTVSPIPDWVKDFVLYFTAGWLFRHFQYRIYCYLYDWWNDTSTTKTGKKVKKR